jgi:predicted nucleic acid-binding protein
VRKKATNLIFKYAKSHNLTIPDALIAATAKSNIPLFTLNLKDFKYIRLI